ncbi:putative archaelysin family metallopeptidase 2 [Lyophyllum shimeji]|uniref:Archaelysin family metallopeptidase 2 n=1 Tax=Lyophyllum shimeji TaxID=47721 RepID=A0A9P3PLJ9_LYOSH|nr:putative archaelysin family metallopeptidase 2 [Lyophyllum shimeji]
MACSHTSLSFVPSANAVTAGYRGFTAQQRASAAVPVASRSKKNASDVDHAPISTFPAPLVLPKDDLSMDPRCPPQSLRSWLRSEERNEVTPKRNVIYVAAPPDVASDVQFVRTWSQPQALETSAAISPPRVKDVMEYLAAFYHGLSVRLLPPPKLCFASWDAGVPKRSKSKSKATIPPYIGLNTATECVRIRSRPSADGDFTAQLNLDDLLDAAISMLPKDAYALLMLVEHDLFEDEDDVFVCGRAYGGSRVAVISTARYHPCLDAKHSVERQHAWPASHCESYLRTCCLVTERSPKRPKKKVKTRYPETEDTTPPVPPPTALYTLPQATTTPMHAAVSAHTALPSLDSSPTRQALTGLWLSRVCRTASHELGHCFGMEHCVYHACAMQSSSCLAEDARQPPYLCPVDLAKMLHATGTSKEARYQALLAFCEGYEGTRLFAAFAAWIRAQSKCNHPQLAN